MGAVAAPSQAASQNQSNFQDGLVNVNVGNVSVLDGTNVAVGVAAQVVAQICGVKVGPVAVLGTAVDRTGVPSTPICTTGPTNLPVTITQAARP